MINTINIKQFMIIPVKGGKMIVQRYGMIYRVFLDCPEGVVELDPCWVQRHRKQLDHVSANAQKVAEVHGREVLSYG